MKVRATGVAALAAGLALVAAGAAYLRYRADVSAARAALARGSALAQTRSGPIEYALRGKGPAMLVIHGAGGGYDQGLLIARDFPEFQVIAPSRFGYLATPSPADPSPAAQAEAHAALLDSLGVDRAIVVAVSAGAPSAVELALRHPDRVRALVLLVPRGYPAGSIEVSSKPWNRLILRILLRGADLTFWSLLRVAPGKLLRFMGVPPMLAARASAAERERVREIMASALPLRRRLAGLRSDAVVELSPLPVDRVQAPTLIITARDDLFDTLPAAEFMARQMPHAELVVLDEGGHLFVGRYRQVTDLVREFLSRLD